MPHNINTGVTAQYAHGFQGLEYGPLGTHYWNAAYHSWVGPSGKRAGAEPCLMNRISSWALSPDQTPIIWSQCTWQAPAVIFPLSSCGAGTGMKLGCGQFRTMNPGNDDRG